MDKDWKVLERRKAFEAGRYCTVELHTLRLPDGRTIDDWAWLIMPDFVNVVVIDTDGNFVLLRQSKYGIEGESLAPVGGYIEPGEDPREAARRETMEELGYEVGTWTYLGSYTLDANRGCGTGHAYLAAGARQVTRPDADDLEHQEIVVLPRERVEEELFSGGVKVLPWANCIAQALLHLRYQRSASGER